jgi:thiamine biosynthesis lipoprotein
VAAQATSLGSAMATASNTSAAASPDGRVTLEAGAMGTRVQLTAYRGALTEEATRGALESALAEIRRLEKLMTTWRDDSEVSAINQAAGRAAVPVGPETFAVLEKSQWVASRSEGVFDITFEAMKGVWKFDEGAVARIPSAAEVEQARQHIDWRKLSLDRAARTAKLASPAMRVGLGGIAKGYAVDAAAKVLARAGLTSYFVQAGGDLYVAGRKPDGAAYRVGARDPRGRGPDDFFALVEVEDHAFSTAGDYERAFLKEGRRYHHILDPRTGWPALACRSVTVWARDAFTADAIDDAVFILGPERGLELVESVDGAGALIVDRTNRVWVSKRLEGKVTHVHPPTDGT